MADRSRQYEAYIIVRRAGDDFEVIYMAPETTPLPNTPGMVLLSYSPAWIGFGTKREALRRARAKREQLIRDGVHMAEQITLAVEGD